MAKSNAGAVNAINWDRFDKMFEEHYGDDEYDEEVARLKKAAEERRKKERASLKGPEHKGTGNDAQFERDAANAPEEYAFETEQENQRNESGDREAALKQRLEQPMPSVGPQIYPATDFSSTPPRQGTPSTFGIDDERNKQFQQDQANLEEAKASEPELYARLNSPMPKVGAETKAPAGTEEPTGTGEGGIDDSYDGSGRIISDKYAPARDANTRGSMGLIDDMMHVSKPSGYENAWNKHDRDRTYVRTMNMLSMIDPDMKDAMPNLNNLLDRSLERANAGEGNVLSRKQLAEKTFADYRPILTQSLQNAAQYSVLATQSREHSFQLQNEAKSIEGMKEWAENIAKLSQKRADILSANGNNTAEADRQLAADKELAAVQELEQKRLSLLSQAERYENLSQGYSNVASANGISFAEGAKRFGIDTKSIEAAYDSVVNGIKAESGIDYGKKAIVSPDPLKSAGGASVGGDSGTPEETKSPEETKAPVVVTEPDKAPEPEKKPVIYSGKKKRKAQPEAVVPQQEPVPTQAQQQVQTQRQPERPLFERTATPADSVTQTIAPAGSIQRQAEQIESARAEEASRKAAEEAEAKENPYLAKLSDKGKAAVRNIADPEKRKQAAANLYIDENMPFVDDREMKELRKAGAGNRKQAYGAGSYDYLYGSGLRQTSGEGVLDISAKNLYPAMNDVKKAPKLYAMWKNGMFGDAATKSVFDMAERPNLFPKTEAWSSIIPNDENGKFLRYYIGGYKDRPDNHTKEIRDQMMTFLDQEGALSKQAYYLQDFDGDLRIAPVGTHWENVNGRDWLLKGEMR